MQVDPRRLLRGSGFRVQGLGFEIAECRSTLVACSGVQGSGLRVEGLGFRIAECRSILVA